MNTRNLAAIAMGLLCVVTLCAAEPPTVTATPSKASVQVAEPFWFDLNVSVPTGANVTFPLTGEKIGDFDVIETRDAFDVPSKNSPERRVWTRRLRLESITTGELSIPALDVQVSDRESSRIIHTEPVAIRVVSVLEDRSDPTQFRDIQSVVDFDAKQPTSNRWSWIALVGLASVGLALAAFVAVVRHDSWMTPSDWAFAKLDVLESAIAATPLDCEEVATGLSSIAREYLQLQFSLSDPGRAADELLAGLPIKKEDTSRLRVLFELADKAKFAGIQLSEDALRSAASDLRDIITSIVGGLEAQSRQANIPETN